MEKAPGYRDAATPETRWRLAWSRGVGWALLDLLGAVVMVPFGLVVLGGATVPLLMGVPFARIAQEWSAGRHLAAAGWALALVPTEAFGLFLAYALLKSGGGGLLDLMGVRRTVEGEVSERHTVRTGKGGTLYCATVAGEALLPSGDAWSLLREGTRVRVQFGRFERAVYRLWTE